MLYHLSARFWLQRPLWVIQQKFHRSVHNVNPITMTFDLHDRGSSNSQSPLIIMHGLFGSKQNWRTMGQALSSKLDRKVYSVDARNHGNSPHTSVHDSEHMAADVAEFMRQQNISKACVMGHSMGGRTMMYFLLKYPELAEKGIIVDISPVSIPRDFSSIEELFSAMKSVSVSPSLSMAQGRKEAAEQMKHLLDYDPDFILLNFRKKSSGEFYWTVNIDVLRDSILSSRPFHEVIEQLPSNTNPTLFICGTHSKFMDPDDWPAVQKIFPSSELVWLDAGHLVHFDQPVDFMNEVTNFLQN